MCCAVPPLVIGIADCWLMVSFLPLMSPFAGPVQSADEMTFVANMYVVTASVLVVGCELHTLIPVTFVLMTFSAPSKTVSSTSLAILFLLFDYLRQVLVDVIDYDLDVDVSVLYL